LICYRRKYKKLKQRQGDGNSTLDYSVTIKDTALSIIGAITNDSFDDASKHIIDRGNPTSALICFSEKKLSLRKLISKTQRRR